MNGAEGDLEFRGRPGAVRRVARAPGLDAPQVDPMATTWMVTIGAIGLLPVASPWRLGWALVPMVYVLGRVIVEAMEEPKGDPGGPVT